MKNTDFYITFKDGSKVSQIERASVILLNLFGTLQSNSVSPEDDAKFQDEVFSLSQIGTAFVDSIYSNISDFIEPDEDKEMTAEPKVDDLAVILSGVLRNPNIPTGIFNALQRAINDIYNDADKESLNDFESSPEYLKAVFEAYEANRNDED